MPETVNTKTRIMDAAMKLFSENGFRATTTRAIAEQAGVNEVTVFRYFGSKEKLFFGIIDREAGVRMDILRGDMEPSGDTVADLTRIGERISGNMLGRADFFKLLVLEVNNFPEVWEHIGTVPLAAIAKLSQYFDSAKKRGLVRRDVDSETMAVSFFSVLFRMLVANAFLGGDLFIRGSGKGGLRDFAEIFVNGIAARRD